MLRWSAERDNDTRRDFRFADYLLLIRERIKSSKKNNAPMRGATPRPELFGRGVSAKCLLEDDSGAADG